MLPLSPLAFGWHLFVALLYILYKTITQLYKRSSLRVVRSSWNYKYLPVIIMMDNWIRNRLSLIVVNSKLRLTNQVPYWRRSNFYLGFEWDEKKAKRVFKLFYFENTRNFQLDIYLRNMLGCTKVRHARWLTFYVQYENSSCLRVH